MSKKRGFEILKHMLHAGWRNFKHLVGKILNFSNIKRTLETAVHSTVLLAQYYTMAYHLF